MPYCTQGDIDEQLPLTELIAMTDDAGTGMVDASVVDRAISDAETVIDAYCQASYTVPFAEAPNIIRRLCVDLAIDNLFARRNVNPPDIRKERAANAVRFLEKVASGQIQLGAETPAPVNTGRAVSVSADDRVFSKDLLSDY